jgi:hypothetical protein
MFHREFHIFGDLSKPFLKPLLNLPAPLVVPTVGVQVEDPCGGENLSGCSIFGFFPEKRRGGAKEKQKHGTQKTSTFHGGSPFEKSLSLWGACTSHRIYSIAKQFLGKEKMLRKDVGGSKNKESDLEINLFSGSMWEATV